MVINCMNSVICDYMFSWLQRRRRLSSLSRSTTHSTWSMASLRRRSPPTAMRWRGTMTWSSQQKNVSAGKQTVGLGGTFVMFEFFRHAEQFIEGVESKAESSSSSSSSSEDEEIKRKGSSSHGGASKSSFSSYSSTVRGSSSNVWDGGWGQIFNLIDEN